MPFIEIPVRESRTAALYDGTNSADLNAAISDFTIVSESAAGLTFNSGGTQYTVAVGGYVAWYQGEVTDVFQNQADFAEVYDSIADAVMNHVHDLVLTTGPAKTPEV